MILDTIHKSLEILLGEAKTTNDCDITASFADDTANSFLTIGTDGLSNGVTPITVVAVPAANTQRTVQEIRLHNNDTITHIVILRLNDNGAFRIVSYAVVPPNGDFLYTPTTASASQALGQWNAGNVDHLSTNLVIRSGNTLDLADSIKVGATLSTGPVVINGGGTLVVPTPGTTTLFQVSGPDGSTTSMEVDAIGGAAGFMGRRANGTRPSSLTGLTAGQSIIIHQFAGYTSAGAYSITYNMLTTQAAETWSASANGSRMNFNSITNGTTVGVGRLRIDQDGASLIDPTGVFTNDGVSKLQVNGPMTAIFHAEASGNNLTLTGSTQAGALILTKGLSVFGTVPANSGALLPNIGTAVVAGTWVDIFNSTVTKAQVYGTGTQTIDGVASATGVPLSGGNRCRFFANTGSTWISAQMGGVSS